MKYNGDHGLSRIIQFHLILNILFALFITASCYYNIPLNNFNDRLAYFIHLCILQSTFAGFLYLLTLQKILFNFLFPIIFLVLSFISFWVFSIDITMSASLIGASLSTKFYIIKDLVSLPLISFITLSFCVLFYIIRFYKSINSRKGVAWFLPFSLLLISLFFYVNKKKDRTLSSKLPYSFFYSLNEYFNTDTISLNEPILPIKTTINEDLKVVFVLGESVRADHLGINGYKRKTTPFLSKKKNVISFKNTYTNKGNTLESVPQILTSESIYKSENDNIFSLFDVIKKRNYSTYWFGNQLLESTYKPIVNTSNTVTIIDEFRSFYSFHKKQDLELLPYLNNVLSKENQGLFSLHMIGSHWWYEDKYTQEFRKFLPVVDSKYIPSLSKEQMVNSYDNTILYLDNFLNEVILELDKQQQPTILIYTSDHGEALGENGKWLHSHFDALTNPAMLVWYSNSFEKRFPKKIKALRNKKEELITTDFIYHSILDLFNIKINNNKFSFFSCEE